MNKELITFNGSKIRRTRDDNKELRYLSVVDVVSILSGSDRPRKYRNDLKTKLASEGSQVSGKIGQLKMSTPDGKMRMTDVADTQTMFRIIQSIPSPNAEPFKLRLAKVGYERIEETQDPELGINRALQNYINKGYDEAWINQRLKSMEVRNALTDERKKRGVLDSQYAILTDEITKARAGVTTKQYKNKKGLKKENLRDKMTNLEIILNMLAEATTTEISKKKKPKGLDQNKKIAQKGGGIVGDTRENIELELGEDIV